ncbi:hypothetical protein GEV33_000036 [Tenebrio molitor]|uniref:Uncharacterized protein n=1 Tax=Tenebrio molitor TaxID=7067 RepID=A0A8J6LHT5_TENMO|nr:hypothetical protein GEV33_000036 [Tenebrio molitor]
MPLFVLAGVEGQEVLLMLAGHTAGNSHQDARFMQLPGRLIAQRNKVQIFRVAILDSGVTKKTHRERKLEDSVGDRRAGSCAASRELRITCVAFGIRNHP